MRGKLNSASYGPLFYYPSPVTQKQRDGLSPLEHALHDGEDYELLLTAKPRKAFVVTRIGTIVEEKGVWLQTDGGRQPLEPRGWEHRL